MYGRWYLNMVGRIEKTRDELACLKYILKNWFNKQKEILSRIYPRADMTPLTCEIMMFKELQRYTRLIHSDRAAFRFRLQDLEQFEEKHELVKTQNIAGLTLKNYAAYIIKNVGHIENLNTKRMNISMDMRIREGT